MTTTAATLEFYFCTAVLSLLLDIDYSSEIKELGLTKPILLFSRS